MNTLHEYLQALLPCREKLNKSNAIHIFSNFYILSELACFSDTQGNKYQFLTIPLTSEQIFCPSICNSYIQQYLASCMSSIICVPFLFH